MINLQKMTKNKFSNIVFFLPKNELVWVVFTKNFFVKLKDQSINQSINQKFFGIISNCQEIFYFKFLFQRSI
jgi:hypothetical protein